MKIVLAPNGRAFAVPKSDRACEVRSTRGPGTAGKSPRYTRPGNDIHSLRHRKWLIEIVDLPIEHGDLAIENGHRNSEFSVMFHRYVNVYQRVNGG